MARTVRDAKLDSRAARTKLALGKRHYRAIDSGLHLGFYRGATGGTWLARMYVGAGKYTLEAIGRADDALDADGDVILNFAQAQAKARKLFVERERQRQGLDPDTSPYTVKKAIEDYKRDYTDRGGKASDDLTTRCNAFIVPKLGDVALTKLGADVIRKWHTDLAKRGAHVRTKAGDAQHYREADDDKEAIRKRRATANRVLAILKAALNHAFANGKVGSDAPWRQVKLFRDTQRARVRWFSVEESKRLINAADAQSGFRDLVKAALLTGCRYGELCALDAGDYETDSRTLLVKTSKTGKPRHVVLSDEGRAFFSALAAGKAADDIMLPKRNGRVGRWEKSHQARPMHEACIAAKVKPAGFHTLRHTAASLAVMGGAPLIVVARNLGHVDTKMVERHYGHLAEGFIATAIREAAPTFGIKADKKVVRFAGAKK